MNFDLETAARVLAVLVPASVTLAGIIRGPGALRSRLRHDVELVEKLPEDSVARKMLLESIASQVDRVTKLETESSRDWEGTIIGTILVVIFLGLAVWLGGLGTWWAWVLAVLTGVFGLAGLAHVSETAQRVPRDEKGNKI
ncbi:MAG: hypothetical protein ACRCTR_08005 [Actinomycetota bacterium]